MPILNLEGEPFFDIATINTPLWRKGSSIDHRHSAAVAAHNRIHLLEYYSQLNPADRAEELQSAVPDIQKIFNENSIRAINASIPEELWRTANSLAGDQHAHHTRPKGVK